MDINREKLTSLLKDFYCLTQIKICVFDGEGREIAYYPEHLCAFCSYIRSTPAGQERCMQSDNAAFELCKKTGQKHVYSCHMGLLECVSPIMHGGVVIGYLMLGQSHGGSRPPFELISRRVAEYGLDTDRAQALYMGIKFDSQEKISAAVNIMEACAGFLYLRRLVKSHTQSLAVRINDFVGANLKGKLSTDMLCAQFGVSRSELYKLFKRFYNRSVADQVKKRRLERACELLRTDMSIGDVAAEAGIGDYNYFSKVFKKSFGFSPSQYRKSFYV